jgi:hypothetical protein
MRVMIVRPFQVGSQTLNAGVLCDPPEDLALDWIAHGYAQAMDRAGRATPATSNPVLDGMLDVSPSRARRAKG